MFCNSIVFDGTVRSKFILKANKIMQDEIQSLSLASRSSQL